jgi:hypothetical protein
MTGTIHHHTAIPEERHAICWSALHIASDDVIVRHEIRMEAQNVSSWASGSTLIQFEKT